MKINTDIFLKKIKAKKINEDIVNCRRVLELCSNPFDVTPEIIESITFHDLRVAYQVINNFDIHDTGNESTKLLLDMLNMEYAKDNVLNTPIADVEDDIYV